MGSVLLPYGKMTQRIDWAEGDDVRVVLPKQMPEGQDESELTREALRHPIGTKPLLEMARGMHSAAIAVPDKTRKAKVDALLPVVIGELLSAGIPREKIVIIVGKGTHGGHTEEEMRRLVGDAVFGKFGIVEHDCKNEQMVRAVGVTPFGTPVEINRHFLDADIKIMLGGVVLHYIAGFGGGRKMIIPGIASYKTIQAAHGRTLRQYKSGKPLEHLIGMLDGNPMNEDLEAATKLVSPDFIVNAVVGPGGSLARVYAGHFIRAHRDACQFVLDHTVVPIDRQADIVLVSCGGYPKDINLTQSHKALHNASYAVKDGGRIVWLAECSQGLGHEAYVQWLALGTQEAAFEKLHREFSIGGHTMWSLMSKCQKYRVAMLSSLPEKDFGPPHCERIQDFPAFWHVLRGEIKSGASAIVLPAGSDTLPRMV